MTLLKPPGLRPGDTIGFFSPSSAATAWAPNRFARAKAYLAAQSFELKAGSLTGERDHWRSGSIAARAEELNALIRDPEVRAIMSVIGGSNSNALLPYLDYEALKRDPKIIIGYSDVTALLLGIHARTGLVTFYGPALVQCCSL
ncbi:LD-carboxypeptidase, partial [Aeromonas media]|uniref:LD-carboxypeptidase n=1 Tax=Aeromonas media TaxID=651 RepID=UPI0005B20633